MSKSKKVTWMSIDKIIDPWGSKDKLKEEAQRGLDNLSDTPEPFLCRKCDAFFQPAPKQWIFYSLCDDCFKQFDTQKMMGRKGTLSKKNSYVKHFEDVNEWIKQKVS
jgi:hypothetical protein